MNKVLFYEGSYQFNLIETKLNISEDFVLMKLSQQYEYRQTNSPLWADVIINGVMTRYLLDYNNIKLTKLN